MLMQKEREEIVAYGKIMSSAGLSSGTSGNISIFNAEEKLVAISPSGIGYFDTKPEDVVVIDLEGNIVEGDKKPSSEWALHTVFYKTKSEARAVVHAHSRFCTTFAVLNQPIRAVHYVIGDAGTGTVPCAPYKTFGSIELAEAAIEACGDGDAVLLGNHGLLTCGSSLKSAYGLACNMEFIAEVQYRAMCIGEPVILSDKEMEHVMNEFKSYGQVKKPDEKSCY
ncbi:MAG: aldolase [Firmicutes bacterium HGW-Firmicutes-7]|nr:MAG: aldolase [Firmicutes bacterium HGW-Firmicutes-7]